MKLHVWQNWQNNNMYEQFDAFEIQTKKVLILIIMSIYQMSITIHKTIAIKTTSQNNEDQSHIHLNNIARLDTG